jgi:hypothetical protein
MTAKQGSAIAIAMLGAIALALSNGPASAQVSGNDRGASDRSARTAGADAFAQAQPKPKPRTRITITPRYYPYRTQTLDYPPPYDIEYPGPGFVRQCKARLVQEARPSGTVIVPATRCWWERG